MGVLYQIYDPDYWRFKWAKISKGGRTKEVGHGDQQNFCQASHDCHIFIDVPFS